jgi:CRISPR-associated endonuclease Csn1
LGKCWRATRNFLTGSEIATKIIRIKEQDFKCVYCDTPLAPTGFASNNTGWQTDHILPWSRFGDDSYLNKTLCCTRCNQHKKGRTPFEWFCEMTETEWDTFLARLENLKEMKGLKKRNFKLRDAAAMRTNSRNETSPTPGG